MKLFMVCIAALFMGWCNLAPGAQTDTNWDLLLENSDVAEELAAPPAGEAGPPAGQPGIGEGRMGEPRRMGGRGRGRGMGMGGGMGEGPGPGAGMGPGGGPGGGPEGADRPRWGMADPEQLLNFLNEHEPKLAEKLAALEKENPQVYHRKLRDVARIYGPIMFQMQRDPEMAELSLEKVRLMLQQQQQVNAIQASGTEKADLKPLRETVGKLFDIIVKQQETRLTKIEERMENMPAAGQGKGQGGGRMNRRMGRMEHFKDRLEQREKNVENWKKNRSKLIEDRVGQLLQGVEPFPWR